MKASKLLASVVFILVAVPTFAQTNPNTDQGIKPYDSFHGGALDSVSVTSGNLFFHETEYSVPQRGHVGLTFSLLYNNKGFHLQTVCVNGSKGPWQMPPGSSPNPSNGGTGCIAKYYWHWSGGHNPGSGVQFISDQTLLVEGTSTDTGENNGMGSEVFAMINDARTADGSTHLLGNTGSGYRAVDASGIEWDGSSASAIDRNGMYGGGLIDTNGNFLSRDSSGNYIDTLGRVIAPPPYFASTQTLPASTASLSSCPNLNLSFQPLVAAYTWNPPGPTGTSRFILCYATVYIRTALFGTGTYQNADPYYDVSQSLNMLQSVVRPDGSAWTFVYDAANPSDTTSIAYGDLLKMGFPTGGSVSYTYGTEFPYQGQYTPDMPTTSSRSVETRTVDANDGTGPHKSTYTWGIPLTNTTTNYVVENTVSDPLGNDTVHQITGFYGGPSLYETQTRYYQGSHTSGTLLKTVNTDYSYSPDPFSAMGPLANPPPTAINVTPIRVTTIWPNGQTSKVETDHDSAFTFHDPMWGLSIYPPLPKQTATYTGTLGTVSAKREYDYGSGGAGNLLRETFTTYFWQGNSNYLTANMLDLPGTVTVCSPLGTGESGDATGCTDPNFTLKRRAQAVSGYDDSARLSGANISTQHGAPSGVRGNLTSVAHWLNTSGCNPQTPGNCPTAYTNWYDAGEVYQSIDPLGRTTTHSYNTAYAGAYPTQTCNALNQCVTGVYDFNSGLVTTFTDPNQQSSTYAYNNMFRMTSAVFPADSSGNHPETDFSYPNVTTVQRGKKHDMGANPPNSISWIVDYAYFDGLGRTIQTRLLDGAGDDYVNTTYDAVGRVSTVSNPHRSTSSLTDGITTSSYDALGRVTQVTAQDGSVSTTDYSNFPTVTVTDPAGKMRRSRTDALGRLVEVDEPGPGANTGGSPGTGSINVSGSLYSSTSSGSYATGSVTVSGSLQTMIISVCSPDTGLCTRQRRTDPGGTVTITVNGHPDQVTYGSSASLIASNLISTINNDGGAFVWASGPSCADSTDCTISLQARTPGPNYSLSVVGLSNDEADGFSSFDSSYASGSTLTGGVYPVTTYDSGTVTVTIGNFQASAAYNQNLNTTASAITNVLISGLNASGSPVTAALSGTTTILLTAKGVGYSTDLTVTGSSTASFTASSTTLSGATNPGGLYAPYVTTYNYDSLGNLLQVNQAGDGSQAARVRTLTYDSFSRLLTSTNPESGTITYTYDAVGNLLTKKSAQANQTGSATTTITYCSDALNRLVAKAYTNSPTPPPTCASGPPYLPNAAVTYTYDQGTNGIEHLTSLTDQAGSASYTYDPPGRMLGEQRTTNGFSKSMSYQYFLDGSISKLTYPSGAAVTYASDNFSEGSSGPYSTGRMVSAIDTSTSTAINYSTSATYAPDSAITGFVSGNGGSFAGIANTFIYNSRLQPCRMTASSTGAIPANCVNSSGNVLDLAYDFHVGNGNNGNVYGITNYRDQTRNQTFTYDQLNRLVSAQNAGTDCSQTTANGKTKFWGNNYGYDAWGNLLAKSATKCTPENLNVTADVQNRVHVGAGADYQYDAAGNMTYNAAGMYYSYDQENRITGGGGYTYVYDADGNRLEKTTGGSTPTGRLYWYMSPGIVAESDLNGNLQSEYVFFDGIRVARKDFPGGAVSYYFSDHLKTTNVVTDAQGNIKNESDFNPWGGELQFANGDSNHYKFTGKERDIETGLDYFGARYYSNGLGRWLTPDWAAKAIAVPFADFGDPQSLNLYSYVRNVPTTGLDPDGHCDNGYCQAAAEQLHMAAGAFIGTIKFMWHNSAGRGIDGMREAIHDLRAGPAAYEAKAYAQGHAVATVLAAANGNVGAQIEVAQRAVHGWNGMSTTQKADAAAQVELTAVTAVVTGKVSAPTGTTALSTSRLTGAGETFTHYGYAADAQKFAGGLRPGGFATSESGLTGAEAQSGLSLPHATPPDAAYTVAPTQGTLVFENPTAAPKFGQPGGLPETQFPLGTGPGTVSAPRPIPLRTDEQ